MALAVSFEALYEEAYEETTVSINVNIYQLCIYKIAKLVTKYR